MTYHQYSLKGVPGPLWAWVEQQAMARDIEINDFIFRVLDFARCDWRGKNPLDAKPVVREVSVAKIAEPKAQFCLRIGEYGHIWQWVIEQHRGTKQPIKTIVLGAIERARIGWTPLFESETLVPQPRPAIIPFTFIDLFAGIGGFRVALQGKLGGACVFSSEWDRFSAQTYAKWFGEPPVTEDIRRVPTETIPDHDILAAGFPCQPFSIAGVSKKLSLGQKHGFECKRQGNLFFRICDIAHAKRPKVMILENVKNLRSHDRGRTWLVIQQELRRIGYEPRAEIIDAAAYVPQHRERIIIVCFRTDLYGTAEDFRFPVPPSGQRPAIRNILEDRPDGRYILTDHLWAYLQRYAKKHREKGNGFGFGLTPLDGISRTLSARYYKDGSEVLVPRRPTDPSSSDRGAQNPRRLTPVEAGRLMGFNFVRNRNDIPVSDTQAYKQFGNAVVPDVIEAVAINVLRYMAERKTSSSRGSAKQRIALRAKRLLKQKVLQSAGVGGAGA
ncbi:MAG: DNA (cytosine-5-)-methyltransferase [Planctomycetaceae bacterium]|nr:DNA (cytosine-5-)-methyltransferase [Planctomycetaceae bacterium]